LLQEKIYEVYQSISFKPEQFNDYLLSAEVGFSSCEMLGTPQHESKGDMLVYHTIICILALIRCLCRADITQQWADIIGSGGNSPG